MMRIKVEYSIEVDDFYRRALAWFLYGENRKATREEMVNFWKGSGHHRDDELLDEYTTELGRREEEERKKKSAAAALPPMNHIRFIDLAEEYRQKQVTT